MDFIIRKASDPLYDPDRKETHRDIQTIEDLSKLDEEFGGHGLIIDFEDRKWKGFKPMITIYDDYVE